MNSSETGANSWVVFAFYGLANRWRYYTWIICWDSFCKPGFTTARAVKRTDHYVVWVDRKLVDLPKYEMALECVSCVFVVSSWRRVWRPKLMLGSRSTAKNFWSTDRNFWNMCSSSGIITTLKRRRRNWRGCVINLVHTLQSAANSPRLMWMTAFASLFGF